MCCPGAQIHEPPPGDLPARQGGGKRRPVTITFAGLEGPTPGATRVGDTQQGDERYTGTESVAGKPFSLVNSAHQLNRAALRPLPRVRSKVMHSHCGFFVTWLVSITAASLRFPSEFATVMVIDAKRNANFRGRLKNCQ